MFDRVIIFASILIFVSCGSRDSRTEIKFNFDADERLFTAHAFMNMAGYDMEYNDDGMHPIRQNVRSTLNQRLPESYLDSIRTYYNKHKHYLGYYGTYALTLTSPPDLTIKLDSLSCSPWVVQNVSALPGLDDRLREFYDRANIHSLWQQHLPQIQEHHDKYRPHTQTALHDLKSFLGVEQLPFDESKGQIITAFSPLLSFFQAFTVMVNNNVHLVFGPQPSEPSPSSYYHEVTHHFTDRVVYEHQEYLERIAPLVQLAEERKGTISYAVIEESIVRAIDIILTSKLCDRTDDQIQDAVNTEYKYGFILCPYFVETLPTYSATGRALEDYFPVLIAGIDIDYETGRWNKFWENN